MNAVSVDNNKIVTERGLGQWTWVSDGMAKLDAQAKVFQRRTAEVFACPFLKSNE
jgi:hypothetical protein